MKFSLKTVAVFATLLSLPCAAEAGVFGSSLLRLTDIQFLKNGSAATASDILTVSDDTDSSTSVLLNGSSAFDFDRPGFDALRSAVGTDPGAENDFGQYAPTGSEYAFADTNGSGDLFAGADVDTIAEMNVLTPNSVGSALGDVTGDIEVRFTVSGTGLYSIQYSGIVNQLAEALAPPAGIGVMTNSEFRVQINGGNANLNDLNADLSHTMTVANTALTGYSNSVTDYVTDQVLLEGNGTEYILTIKQLTSVNLFTVPEPTSALVFASLALVGFVRRRS